MAALLETETGLLVMNGVRGTDQDGFHILLPNHLVVVFVVNGIFAPRIEQIVRVFFYRVRNTDNLDTPIDLEPR